MKNAKMMIDVMVKDLTVVVATGKVRDDGCLMITRKVSTAEPGVPAVATALAYAAGEIGTLIKAGISDRIAIIMPEQAVIRAAEAQKIKNQGGDMETLIKDWMLKSSPLEAEGWTTALRLFGAAVSKYAGTIVWQNARSLYRWEVKSQDPTGSDMATLDEVTFTNGANVDLGLIVAENQYYNETAKVTVTKIRQRNGNFRYRAFVPRMFTVRDANGENQHLDAFTVSNPELAVEGLSDSHAAVINALRLHVKAAEKLPKVKVAAKIVVEDKD